MSKVKSFDDLFLHELKDLYSAEKQVMKALPKMAKAATDASLKKAFETHLTQTEAQIARLDAIAKELNLKLDGHACKAMKGLIEEGDEIMKDVEAGELLDAALICAAQRVEHYEMAGYGCARTFAGLLGHKNVQKLLQQTLDEEGTTDKNLTKLAEGVVNAKALTA